MAGCMHPPRVVPAQGIVFMKQLLILGFALAVLTATCSAQGTQTPRIKHSQVDQPKSAKSVVVAKTPPSSTEADLRRLEQQMTKLPAPQRVKRAPGMAPLLKTEKEKPTPPINFSSAGKSTKGPGTTTQGTNPYRGRLRQKGSGH